MRNLSLSCLDCKKIIRTPSISFPEDWLMVKNEIWQGEFGLKYNSGCLCPECIKNRLGRDIELDDLIYVPMNFWYVLVLLEKNKVNKTEALNFIDQTVDWVRNTRTNKQHIIPRNIQDEINYYRKQINEKTVL